MLRDTFVAVSSGPVTNAGEYLIGTGLTNAPNSAVYGGTVVGFNTNQLWYGNTELFVPQAESLTYTGGVKRSFISSGGRLKIDLAAADDSEREVRRRIQGVTASATWHFSALLRATEDADGTAVVRFDDVNGGSVGGIVHSPYMWGCGFGFQNGTIVLITRSGSNSRITHTVMEEYVAGETYLIIVKIAVDTGLGGDQYNDTVEIWVNPPGLLSADAGTPDFTVGINTITSQAKLLIDELRITTGGFGGGVVEIDEVRMGRQWYDVVPSVVITDLIVYDDFSTEDGQYRNLVELTSQGPLRPGFIGDWYGALTYWKTYDEGLTYSYKDQGLQTSAGSAQVHMPSALDRISYRRTVGRNDSLLYISSLMSFDLDGESDDFAYAEWLDPDDPNNGGIQWGVFGGKLGIRGRYTASDINHVFAIGDGSYVEGQTYLFVIKMEKDVQSYWDRMTVYLNPQDLSSEAANTKSLETLAANLVGTTVLDQIKLRSTQVKSGVFKVDEIRIGSSWGEVVPYEIVPYNPPGTLILIQ